MKTTTINIYTYSELNDKAKEKARNWYLEGEDFPFLTEYLTEQLNNELKNEGISIEKDLKIDYSLTCSQGDGFSFTGEFRWCLYAVTIFRFGCRYVHENSTEYVLVDHNGKEANKKTAKQFSELYKTICRRLEKIGYEYIDYQRSEEFIVEVMEANSYTFLADGTRFDA